MGITAIASYKPKPGLEAAFLRLLEQHIPAMRAEGLVSAKPSYTMRSKDGTIVEVFEWLSAETKNRAHENPSIMQIWNQFFELAEMVPLCMVEEANEPFANFETLFR